MTLPQISVQGVRYTLDPNRGRGGRHEEAVLTCDNVHQRRRLGWSTFAERTRSRNSSFTSHTHSAELLLTARNPTLMSVAFVSSTALVRMRKGLSSLITSLILK